MSKAKKSTLPIAVQTAIREACARCGGVRPFAREAGENHNSILRWIAAPPETMQLDTAERLLAACGKEIVVREARP